MRFRHIIAGLLIGLCLAGVIAVVPTLLDWYHNPGSVFRDEQGTHWPAVWETAWSWFWPAALLALPVAMLVACLFSVRRSHECGGDEE